MDKLISVFGSLEDIHAKYHCIECRKKYNVRKDGRLKPEKRTRKKKVTSIYNESEDQINPSKSDTNKTFITSTGGRGQRWSKPAGMSDNKWASAIKATIKWGVKKGILHSIKENK